MGREQLDADGATTGNSSKCDLKIWHSRLKEDGSRERTTVALLDQAELPRDDSALVVERKFDEKNRLESTTLEVNSPYVLKAFQQVVGTHPTLAEDFSKPFSIELPSEMLFHCWNDLEIYCSKSDDDTVRSQLGDLLRFMDVDMGTMKRAFEAQVGGGLVDYSRLHMLFRPGDLVIHHVKSQPWLLRVSKSAYEEKPTCGKYFELHCEYSDYDGTTHGRSKKVFAMLQRQFFGQDKPCQITDLPVYPYHPDPEDEDLRHRLHERGQRYQAFASVSVREYDGPAEFLKESPYDFFDKDEEHFPQVWLPYHETGRVIVDRKTYEQETYKGQVSRLSMEALETITYAPYVLGFSCNRKNWCRFYLEHLQDVPWKLDAFDELILPSLQRDLLEGLVSSHQFMDDVRDETKQKGKGLVVLLHGPPGCGKTMSAECSAEITQKALFSTSMSELNKFNSTWDFERNLTGLLRLASTWKSIVLFDEADVFLEARQGGEGAQERNSLVAVFLRHLEYFSGIVFLTTNRVQVFDAAMKSRIHLALTYHEPDELARRQIWARNVDKVTNKDETIVKAVDRLAITPLNGREISNTITTACTLARYRGVPLGTTHVDQVLGVRKEFDMSLEEVQLLKNAPLTVNTKKS
ncbi:P-loop containing nucleoside triphosphate hydrolase protein [Myriangium duriaei CBS 260.36]|uniref:P-loop containing nucleoside triphosphate hydrolase protein n=1 Tax=Myriangium duriaei CBS 260.36 TaxID=1168546 RepID=A0A9P4IV86_9PEZI|nr:P-loop containing nucleoside triphosphate hydrolase protein [Myriangium duriaei CBS 260.36]